jgi:hypothetical protein
VIVHCGSVYLACSLSFISPFPSNYFKYTATVSGLLYVANGVCLDDMLCAVV